VTKRSVERSMVWSIGNCGARSASGKRLAQDSERGNSEIKDCTSRDEAAAASGLSDISNHYQPLDCSNTSELCTGGAENICSEGLPILDCLPRGNLTALTAGILGSLYQIIQDYFVCTKF